MFKTADSMHWLIDRLIDGSMDVSFPDTLMSATRTQEGMKLYGKQNKGPKFISSSCRHLVLWHLQLINWNGLFFTFMLPCIVTNFFIIKPNRCTNFTSLFCHETLHVSESFSVHHQEFIHCTFSSCRQLSSTTRMEFNIWNPGIVHRNTLSHYSEFIFKLLNILHYLDNSCWISRCNINLTIMDSINQASLASSFALNDNKHKIFQPTAY